MAIKTQYIVAGIEFESLDDAKQFDVFLNRLPETAHPYQLEDDTECSYELEMQISARAVIETLRVAYGNKADLIYAEPELVWRTALQNGFVVPEPPKPPKKVAPKKVAPKKNTLEGGRDWS